ncbi:MAG: aryl-sulfate sulfotransferase [bacterium]|nr:aryl-sulfate sulfotransferase [bacterium]
MLKTYRTVLSVHSLLLFLSTFFFFNFSYSQSKTQGLIKHLSGTQENGYVLFSPIRIDTTYLIDRCGKKVHQWASLYSPGLSTYLKPNGHLLRAETYLDTSFGTAGGRGGFIEEFDWDGNVVWKYKLINDSLCQHHDIHPMPNGNIMVLAWHSISRSRAIALGRDTSNFSINELWGERLIELKPIGTDSAVVVWQWDLFDHIIQDIDVTKPNYGTVSLNPQLVNINYAHDLKTFDWIHANGFDYNAKLDQIVISCHNLSEIWIIDHSTTTAQAKSHIGGNNNKGGDLLYRWGNPQAYKKGTSLQRKLFKQHNAQWIPGGFKDSGCIMVFNNGWDRDTSYSSIDIITPPLISGNGYNATLPYLPNTLTWQYKDSIPTNFYSQIISGTQRLANGNTLICSGVQGRFFEVTYKKKIVWEYKVPISWINTQNDGDFARNNNVFRCTFYPDNFLAFKNKDLSQKGNIELNSYLYTCKPDQIAPKLFGLTPSQNQIDVIAKPKIQMTFDETVLKKTGRIKIFENNKLIESINIDSANVVVNNNIVTLIPIIGFSYNSIISLSVPANAFRDSANNLVAAIDSSKWHFYTIKPKLLLDSVLPKNLSLDINSNRLLKLFFKDSVIKNNSGLINIYENNTLKESLLISSNRIAIDGAVVTITPSSPFSLDALISIEVGACFKNNLGALNIPITKGNWIFATRLTPKIILLSPDHKANNVILNPTLSITYDRPIRVAKSGNLIVYEDGFPVDAINVNGPRSMITGNTISFDLNSDLLNGARVSIELESNLLADTMGTYCSAIDSSEWIFNTLKSSSVKIYPFNKNVSIYPNPNNGTFTLKSTEAINTLQLFDGQGRLMELKSTLTTDFQSEITTTHIASGIYILRLNNLYTINILIQ